MQRQLISILIVGVQHELHSATGSVYLQPPAAGKAGNDRDRSSV